ncbi:trimethylguanosine synthase [Chaetoceros tenuissimus]|uniref:Trimethylguanosine synthase n=1 Tax=Chaetoceros tenuissimus TaxID=426638 RepID=A0AAD3CHE2_9STRA|nr:trimethylguanosine synthase [Chaetoceros tenuissimus]
MYPQNFQGNQIPLANPNLNNLQQHQQQQGGPQCNHSQFHQEQQHMNLQNMQAQTKQRFPSNVEATDMTVIVQAVNLYDGPKRNKFLLEAGISPDDLPSSNENQKEESGNGDGLADFFDSPALTQNLQQDNHFHQNGKHHKHHKQKEPPPPCNLFYYCRPPPAHVMQAALSSATNRIFKIPIPIISKRFMSDTNHNIYMDQSVPNPYPDVQDKYWVQRRRLFSRFDKGIQLDAEGWFSVTPEIIADHVTGELAKIIGGLGLIQWKQMQIQRQLQQQHMMQMQNLPGNVLGGPMSQLMPSPQNQGLVLLDAFCGCGGNSIAFAKLSSNLPVSMVVCVDLDRNKLRMAAKNASIYGIPRERIVFVQSDSLHVLANCYQNGRLAIPKRSASQGPSTLFERCDGYLIGGLELLPDLIDIIFMDPPWGGTSYEQLGKNGYDLVNHMRIPYGGGKFGEAQVDESANGETGFANGADLLRMAAQATSTRIVLYDIPRNTSRESLGKAALFAGYRGNIRLDEHYLNGRLKTVTAYLGCDHSHLLQQYQAELLHKGHAHNHR